MKSAFPGSAASIVLLCAGVLAGCASGPPRGPCDTAQSLGTCAVTVQMQGSRLVVCPANTAASSPVCMNTTLDVQRSGRAQKMQIMLLPGRCQALSSDVTSAASNLCQAYAPRSHANPAAQPTQSAESAPRSE